MNRHRDDSLHIASLLVKRFEGTISQDEARELDQWRDSSEANHRLYDEWQDRERVGRMLRELGAVDWERAEREGRRRIRRSSRIRMLRRIAIPVAASAAVAVALLMFRNLSPGADTLLADDATAPVPVLILENGEQIPVDQLAATPDPTVGYVSRTDSVAIVYSAKGDGGASSHSYHTIRVPRGSSTDVVLPDGTHVWLNAQSEMRFPTSFADAHRTVELKGEAYFEVVGNAERPFRVSLAAATVTVTGTRFNVTDYECGPISATLVDGAIDFESGTGKKVTLRPSQRLTYDAERDEIEVGKVNTKSYTAWTNGTFFFDGVAMGCIAAELERWYDVKFRFESPELERIRLSVHVGREERLETLLGLFEKGAGLKFEVKERTIMVTSPNNH